MALLTTGELAGWTPHLPTVGPALSALSLTPSLSFGSVIALQAPHGIHFFE